MRELTIEYLFEGHKRGYNFTSPTGGFNDDTLKFVWRSAMPRGQGWGADVYKGARSLKGFALLDGRIAISETIVTELRDESGRAGIRRCHIEVMQPGEYLDNLRTRLKHYSERIQAEISRKPRFGERRAIPRIKGDQQTVLSYPYSSTSDWAIIEALVLKTASDELDKTWLHGKIIPFTTLALDYHDESQLVVLPDAKAEQLGVKNFAIFLRPH